MPRYPPPQPWRWIVHCRRLDLPSRSRTPIPHRPSRSGPAKLRAPSKPSAIIPPRPRRRLRAHARNRMTKTPKRAKTRQNATFSIPHPVAAVCLFMLGGILAVPFPVNRPRPPRKKSRSCWRPPTTRNPQPDSPMPGLYPINRRRRFLTASTASPGGTGPAVPPDPTPLGLDSGVGTLQPAEGSEIHPSAALAPLENLNLSARKCPRVTPALNPLPLAFAAKSSKRNLELRCPRPRDAGGTKTSKRPRAVTCVPSPALGDAG